MNHGFRSRRAILEAIGAGPCARRLLCAADVAADDAAPDGRGPKTTAGKARSARHALTHGLRARLLVLLNDEDAPISLPPRPCRDGVGAELASWSHPGTALSAAAWRRQCRLSPSVPAWAAITLRDAVLAGLFHSLGALEARQAQSQSVPCGGPALLELTCAKLSEFEKGGQTTRERANRHHDAGVPPTPTWWRSRPRRRYQRKHGETMASAGSVADRDRILPMWR
jgi:hypothetical protein